MSDQDWLIYDGDCAFCRHTVRWVEQHDKAHRFRPEPFQTCPSPPMTPALRQQAAREVQVVTSDGHRIADGRAVLFILDTIGWQHWLVRLVRRPPCVWLVEVGYHVVSRYRDQLSKIMFRMSDDQKGHW